MEISLSRHTPLPRHGETRVPYLGAGSARGSETIKGYPCRSLAMGPEDCPPVWYFQELAPKYLDRIAGQGLVTGGVTLRTEFPSDDRAQQVGWLVTSKIYHTRSGITPMGNPQKPVSIAAVCRLSHCRLRQRLIRSLVEQEALGPDPGGSSHSWAACSAPAE